MRDRVILYGLGSKMLNNQTWYDQNFDIVGFSDSNPDKRKNIPFPDIPYVLPENIMGIDFDYVIICSVKAKEIFSFLNSELGIPSEKIKTDHEVWVGNFFDDVHCYGGSNPDRTIVIIGRECETNGLFWYVNLFLQYIRETIKRNYIPVIDMQNFHSAYLEKDEFKQVNAWEFYFEQPANISLEEAYKSSRVIHIPDTNIISDGLYTIGNLYYDKPIRQEFCNILAKYIRLNKEMREKVSKEYRKLIYPIRKRGEKILGVLYRGTDFQNIRPYLHPRQPSIEECIDEVKRKMNEWEMDYVYLSTDDENAVIAMQKAIGERFLCYDRKRFSNTGKTQLAFISFDRERDRYVKGADYLTEICLLAQCDSLVAGKAGGTTGALLLNQMKYEKEYFFELGLYGLEE